jgi:hypothetical protein
MQHSPSSEGRKSSVIQDTAGKLWNPKFRYRYSKQHAIYHHHVQLIQSMHHTYFLNIQFNINFPSIPSFFTQSLSFRLSTQNSLLFFSPKVCHIPHPSNPPFFHQNALKL